MVKDLFINMTILISFIGLGSQFIKKFNYEDNSNLSIKIFIGTILGILGCLLMLFSVKVNDNTIIDFRNIAIVISVLFGGVIPAIITTALIAIFRVVYFGVNIASLIGVVAAVLNFLGCCYIAKRNIKTWGKWIYAIFYVLVIATTAIFLILRTKDNVFIIMLLHGISFCLVSAITYWYIEYNLASNKLFNKLQKESTKDFLTGLNNVRQFDFVFNSTMKNALDKEESLSLLMVDIDFFKKVNDTYGHIEGDVVLKDLGKILSENCRHFDEVSRNGGEEFSVLLPDCAYPRAMQIAERIKDAVKIHTFTLSTGVQIHITISIGVASYPETIQDIEKLMEKADTALYAAKRSGRNRVCS